MRSPEYRRPDHTADAVDHHDALPTARGEIDGVHQATRDTGLQPVSKEVYELVCTCNAASRADKGDIVWFGYNCSDNKKDPKREGTVAFGTQGVAFTRPAAKILKEHMVSRKPKLFDMFLKDTLHTDFTSKKGKWLEGLKKSCYISPPLGGFYEHETEIYSPHGKVRPSLFGADWGQEGSVGAVRPTDRPRLLRAFPCWNEPGEQVMKLPLPSALASSHSTGRRCCHRSRRNFTWTAPSRRCWGPWDI